MPDERMESLRRGIAAPPESPAAAEAAAARRAELAKEPPIDGGLGGTSDAETAADEALMNAELHGAGAGELASPPHGGEELEHGA